MTEWSQASQFLQARWILPISEPAKEFGWLVLENDKILGVISPEEYSSLPEKLTAERSQKLGDAIICPGLMNLHTHLDYSGLKHFDNYSPFFGWIRGLIGNSWQWSPDEWLQSALLGAKEIMHSGTSMVLDASYSGAAARAVARSGFRGIVGLELFGIVESDADLIFDAWLQKYAQFVNEAEPELKNAIRDGRVKVTIAPHTPYSVCPELIRKALNWSKVQELPLLIHISESEAECRWIAADDDDLNAFLAEAFRVQVPELPWRGHGLSPVKHLDKHGLLADNVIAAHLVQVDDSDIACLAHAGVSAVHCPRSNSRLRNGISPMSKIVDAGIALGFGTDSAASGDDLDVLAEARFAWDLHRAVDKQFAQHAERALFYLTQGSARILKLDKILGSLESGKKADFAIFSIEHLPNMAKQRPFEALIYGGAKLQDLRVDGVSLIEGGYIASDKSEQEAIV